MTEQPASLFIHSEFFDKPQVPLALISSSLTCFTKLLFLMILWCFLLMEFLQQELITVE